MDESSNKDKEDSKYPEVKKTLIEHLMMLHFQINFILYILSFDKNDRIKERICKIRTFGKWKYCKSIPLRYLLSKYHHLYLWDMANKMVMNEK